MMSKRTVVGLVVLAVLLLVVGIVGVVAYRRGDAEVARIMAGPGTCPHCRESISARATICPHCQSKLR